MAAAAGGEGAGASTMRAGRLAAPIEAKVAGGFAVSDLAGKLDVVDVARPKPRAGEVLVRVARASVNPADLSMLKGSYGTATGGGGKAARDDKGGAGSGAGASEEKAALVVGSEGCGTVVGYGGGLMAWRLMGKRVAFAGSRDGAWTEYAVVPATKCIDVGDTPWDDCAACFTNPMTVLAFVELCKAGNHTSVLHTAAASALGRMLIRFGRRNGIQVVCVVRKEEQVKTCLAEGAPAENVFNSSDADFQDKLRARCAELKTTIGFDAVSGTLAGTMLSCMPDGSSLHVYGGLSEDGPKCSTRDLIFKRKQLKGFWLVDYIKTKSLYGLLQWTWAIVPRLTDDFKNPVTGVYALEDLHGALVAYTANMGAGKILITCDGEGATAGAGASATDEASSSA